jgi:dihydroorotate dehydrogenase (NAD+) catalytic subunit
LKDLSIKLFGETLRTPLIPASGVFGYGDEYDFTDYKYIGAFVTKGLSLKPREGNPTPRVTEVYASMLNSIGLQNIGAEKFISEKLPVISKLGTKIIVNFFGNTEEEYVELARLLCKEKSIFALEMNVSCPNVKKACISFGQDPQALESLTQKVKNVCDKPLIVKLTPNVTDIVEVAKAAEKGGADALSMINTVKGMAIDINTKKPLLAATSGGLSGRAIKPIAIRAVYDVAQSGIKLPIIGMGGISNYEDVLEFMIAGATVVQIGTAIFTNPNICQEICFGLQHQMI